MRRGRVSQSWRGRGRGVPRSRCGSVEPRPRSGGKPRPRGSRIPLPREQRRRRNTLIQRPTRRLSPHRKRIHRHPRSAPPITRHGPPRIVRIVIPPTRPSRRIGQVDRCILEGIPPRINLSRIAHAWTWTCSFEFTCPPRPAFGCVLVLSLGNEVLVCSVDFKVWGCA